MGPEPRCKRNAMASEKSGKTQDDVLVSTAWLSRRLADPDLVVIDASVLKDEDARGNRIWRSGRSAFETAGHIPGARFADLIADFSDPDAPHAFTRPGTGRFAGAAGKLGLSNRARIVAYDNTTGIWAARLWWLLRAFGHDHAAVLDGGLTAWIAESRPLERGPGAANHARFTARERPGCFVDQRDVLAVVEGAQRDCSRAFFALQCLREWNDVTPGLDTFRAASTFPTKTCSVRTIVCRRSMYCESGSLP
jgi:3-mercaptopyruvate sulfurtransferase SseA